MESIVQTTSAFDPVAARREFPTLSREVYGKPLVYLDNAATTQKPLAVIESLDHYYRHYNSNVHRGLHALSEEATNAFEKSRIKAARFLNAPDAHEV